MTRVQNPLTRNKNQTFRRLKRSLKRQKKTVVAVRKSLLPEYSNEFHQFEEETEEIISILNEELGEEQTDSESSEDKEEPKLKKYIVKGLPRTFDRDNFLQVLRCKTNERITKVTYDGTMKLGFFEATEEVGSHTLIFNKMVIVVNQIKDDEIYDIYRMATPSFKGKMVKLFKFLKNMTTFAMGAL